MQSGGTTNLEPCVIGGVDKGEGVLDTGEEEGGMKMVAVFKNSAGDGVKGREAFMTIRRTRSERCRRHSDSVT